MTLDIFTVCKTFLTHSVNGYINILEAVYEVSLTQSELKKPIQHSLGIRLRYDASEVGDHAIGLTVTDPEGKELVNEPAESLPFSPLKNASFGCLNFCSPMKWVPTTHGDYSICLTIDGHKYTTQLTIHAMPQRRG